jgi:hypothetical protein
MKRKNDIDKIDSEIATGCLMWTLAFILVVALMFIGPAIELWLWSAIVVPNFALPMLGYWEMFGLHWLIGLLFGSRTSITQMKDAIDKD